MIFFYKVTKIVIAFSNYHITGMHNYHSIGKVNAGKINQFVFTSPVHCNNTTAGCKEIV